MKLVLTGFLGACIGGTIACDDNDSPSDNQICGGIAGAQCDANEFCKFPSEAMCGAADATGICEPTPTTCTDIYAPVCGCDDKTYPNECTANAAGVSVAQPGECPNESTLGKACGGKTADQPRSCDEGQFCNYRLEDLCGQADASGICKEIPTACDKMLAPVCGCDGKDYGNECEANAAGTAVATQGQCVK